MLLERERERLLAVLQSRSSSHAERVRARQALEEAEREADERDVSNGHESVDRQAPADEPR